MKFRGGFGAFILVVLAACSARATTVTFEGLPVGYTDGMGYSYNYFQSVTTQGFTFSSPYLWYNNYAGYCGPQCSTDGSFTLSDLTYATGAPLAMTAADDSPFSLDAFDVAGTFTGVQPGVLTVTGYLAPGGTLSEEITLGVPYNPDPFVTETLSGWDDLTSVTFSMPDQGYYDDFAIDNVVANESPTPEPPSVTLMGSGLLGLAVIFRRKLRLASQDWPWLGPSK